MSPEPAPASLGPHDRLRATGPRVAIVGAGMIAAVHLRSAVLAGADVTGVLASSPDRSAEVAHRWRLGRAYRDIDEVVTDPRVDLVHICTPNANHAPFAEAALRAGKHVICEKPLGVSLAEAERMHELAAASELVATVPFVYRYHPVVRELRDRRIAGEFGEWNLIHGSYLQDWMLAPAASGWRVDPGLGGASRAFADIGSHWCDLVEWVSGEQFAELLAATSIAIPRRPANDGPPPSAPAGDSDEHIEVSTEDSAVLLLRSAQGVLTSATVSQVAAGRKNRLWFELDGAHGSAVFDQENPESLWLGTSDGANIVVRDLGKGSAEQQRLSQLPAGHGQGYAQCFEAFVADTYAAVAGNTLPGLPTFADGLRSARLVDAVLRSSAANSWIKV